LTGDAQPDLWLLLRFQLMFTAIYIAVSLVYSVGFQGRFGATPGKRLLGLRVVTLEGVPLSYGGALRRYCAELLSVLSFGLGYLMVLAPEKRALHDILTGTQVVLTPRD
jgi:uncharacterized RDD family membrane protein YckC